MTNRTESQRIVTLAYASIVVLAAMVLITMVTGVSQETFEIVRHPAIYGDELRRFALPLRALFGLDSGFLVLYGTLIVLVARRFATEQNRGLIAIVIGAVMVTALADMIEDHFILALLRGAERGIDPTAGQITFEHTLSQVKFNVSYLGLFVLGLCAPMGTTTGRLLAFFLTIGTIVQGAWLYAAPDAMLPAGNFGRWVGFLIGFALIIRLEHERSFADAGATGALA